jgi:hypothetical protein
MRTSETMSRPGHNSLARRVCAAQQKLRKAQQRLARTERSVAFWTRVLDDLQHERTLDVQQPLWPVEDQDLYKS